MAAMHGKAGTATFTNLTFELLSWSVEGTADMAEATDMGDTYKTYLAGFKDWTASCECNLPTAGAGIAALGTTATLTIDSTTGLAYSGTAFCNGFGPAADKDDIAKITLTFQGSGTLGEA